LLRSTLPVSLLRAAGNPLDAAGVRVHADGIIEHRQQVPTLLQGGETPPAHILRVHLPQFFKKALVWFLAHGSSPV
jgi:hypothetical protein